MIQESEDSKAAAIAQQASAEEAAQDLQQQLDWQAERIAELESHVSFKETCHIA